MSIAAKKLLKNQALGLSVRVTDQRLLNAGIQVVKPSSSKQSVRDLRIPEKLTKRLASA